jgi:protein-disulfide isomerase
MHPVPKILRYAACYGVIALLAAAPAASAADPAFSPEQEKRIETLVHDYLLENPEVLQQAFERLQQRRQAEAQVRTRGALATHRRALFEDPSSPIAGNPKGDVTVVEFFDYRCGYCKRVFSRVERLIAEDAGVRVVLKEFPILGPASLYASRAALAARGQQRYKPFHDALMGWRGDLTRADVLQIASEIGLNVNRLQRDMADPQITEAINRNIALAQALGITGTPAFVIGDTLVPGAIEFDALRDLVRRARAS